MVELLKVLTKWFSGISSHFNKKMGLMLLGNLLTIVINIATVKILTNKYSVFDFGTYSLIISFTTLPQLVLFAPIASAIFPFIKQRKEELKYEEFQKNLFELFFLVVIILVFIIFGLLAINLWLNFINNDIIYLVLVSLLFSATLSWLAMLDTFSLANFKIKEYTIFPIINLLLKLIVLGIIFNVKVQPSILILLFGILQFLFCVIEHKFLTKKKILTYVLKFNEIQLLKVSSSQKREILMYAKNFFIWGLFGWAQNFFDKWFLNQYTGSDSVGIYAVYYQYGFFPFTIFSSIISQYITPIYFSKLGDNRSSFSFLKKLILYCIFFLIVFCIALVALAYWVAPYFIEIFTNKHYLVEIGLFPIIVLAGCFYGFGQIITVPLLNSDFVKRIRFPKIASSIAAVILFYMLVPKLGLLGILLSLCLSNLFYFISLFLININYLKKLKGDLDNS